MELHFFKTSSDFYFFFHFKFLSTFSLTDIEPALTLHLASPDLVPRAFNLVPRAFPLKKNGRSHFCRKSPGDEVGHPHHSPLQKREGNWAELTFAKSSGTISRTGQQLTGASPVTLPETIVGRIQAPVPFSFLKWAIACFKGIFGQIVLVILRKFFSY